MTVCLWVTQRSNGMADIGALFAIRSAGLAQYPTQNVESP